MNAMAEQAVSSSQLWLPLSQRQRFALSIALHSAHHSKRGSIAAYPCTAPTVPHHRVAFSSPFAQRGSIAALQCAHSPTP